MSKVTEALLKYKTKYPLTLAFRSMSHAKVIEIHLNPDDGYLNDLVYK